MATGGKDLCDICNNQHITIEAIVFCPECDEQFCERCSANHSVAKLSRKHECIPLENVSMLPQFVQDIKPFCSDHDERYEYFCSEHDEPCCITCLKNLHSKCRNMSSINNVVKDVKVSPAFCDLENMLSDLIHNISNVIKDRRENLQELKKQKTKFLHDIQAAREVVNATLDKMEAELKIEMEMRFSEKESEIDQLLDKFAKYQTNINKSKEFVDKIKIFASEFQTFIAIRKLSGYSNRIEKATRNLFEGKDLIHICISMTPNRLNLRKDIFNSLGSVNVKFNSRKIFLKMRKIHEAQLTGNFIASTKIKDIQLKVIFEVMVPYPDRTNEINVCGRCILKDNEVIISDNANQRLVIFNIDGDFRKVISLTFIPLGIVSFKFAQIIIAEYNQKQLKLFDLEKEDILKTVACDGNLLMKSISMKDNDILIQNGCCGFSLIDLDGKAKSKTKTILSDSDLHEAVCIKEHIFYVANDGICCCDMKGGEIWKFKNLHLRKPYALTSNGYDVLFTADYQTGCVFAIGTDGKSFKKIEMPNGQLNYASSMYYSKDKKKLLIVTQKGMVFLFDVGM